MKYFIHLIFIVFVSYSFQSKADYLNIAVNTGTFDGDCTSNTTGTVVSNGSSCTFTYPVYLDSGADITNIYIYFYDKSGSASVSASFIKEKLSSDSSTTIDSDSSTSTSSSVQTLTLSGDSSALSSSYAYLIRVTINYGTKLTGIKIAY